MASAINTNAATSGLSHFPGWWLSASLLMTAVAIRWLLWVVYSAYLSTQESHARQLESARLYGRLIYLHEALTMSARMAATGNLTWIRRYYQFKPPLTHTWEAARKRQRQADLAKLNAQTESAYLKMRNMEVQAIQRVKHGQLQRARTLMFSDAYAGQQWLFEQWPAQLVQRTESQIRVEELRGIILRLDEVLTMSARLAAASANAIDGDRERCLAAGMDEVLAGIRAMDRGATGNLLSKLVSSYQDASAELMEELREAVARHDAERVRKSAHTLKSSSANLAALRLSSLCKSLEDKARSQILDGAEQMLARIEAEYVRVLAALAGECGDRVNVATI